MLIKTKNIAAVHINLNKPNTDWLQIANLKKSKIYEKGIMTWNKLLPYKFLFHNREVSFFFFLNINNTIKVKDIWKQYYL